MEDLSIYNFVFAGIIKSSPSGSVGISHKKESSICLKCYYYPQVPITFILCEGKNIKIRKTENKGLFFNPSCYNDCY